MTITKTTAVQLLTNANLHVTNWGKRIVAAEERTYFDVADNYEANNNWVSDVNDLTHSNIVLNDRGRPEDKVLRHEGCDVTICIDWDDFIGAAEHLIAMNERSNELKHMILPA
jgi:hypothetical protein